ncbi:MAG: hypothetical protein SCABRO_02458 [Candidatus Scalindua brodae]|uniref:Uncharacterized protein n=1 Tax=Candidatus Scalindua brodae TaxID=237368 RepID=A0A0B0EGU5_9BACT|nr:MAG: hypothetical protein SCABRO_02458 [Candidatus Scalindua brodae]
MLYSQVVIAVVNIPIVIISFFENIGPTLMQLPLHHCIYCFMGKGIVPDAPVILALYLVQNSGGNRRTFNSQFFSSFGRGYLLFRISRDHDVSLIPTI